MATTSSTKIQTKKKASPEKTNQKATSKKTSKAATTNKQKTATKTTTVANSKSAQPASKKIEAKSAIKKDVAPDKTKMAPHTLSIYNEVEKYAKANKLPFNSNKARGMAFEKFTLDVLINLRKYKKSRKGVNRKDGVNWDKGSYDFGADLIVDEYDEDDDELYHVLVQCKFYTSGNVKYGDVMMSSSSMRDVYQCDRGLVITSTGFSSNCKTVKNSKLELIDGKKFLKMIKDANKRKQNNEDDDDYY